MSTERVIASDSEKLENLLSELDQAIKDFDSLGMYGSSNPLRVIVHKYREASDESKPVMTK